MDLTLLRLLRTRERYEKLIKAVPTGALDLHTSVILDDFGKFFREFPDVGEITGDGPFWTWFRSFAHPSLNDQQRSLYQGLLKQINDPVPPELEAGLMDRLVAADTAQKLLTLVENFNEGKEIDLGAALRATVEQFELDTNRKVKTPWVKVDIDAMLEDTANDRGLHWRQPELNVSMRPLIPGDFGIIAGRPDKGKTTFLTDNLTYFAAQLADLDWGKDRPIAWFNNEGPGDRIVRRMYQSALNATGSDLVARSKAKTLRRDYRDAVGHEDNLRVFDIHDFWNHEVEDIIRQTNPSVVVFDMVDNIKFGGAVSNNGQRTDQLLEAMYQWARIIGVKHHCVVLATSQISADGENLAYPTLSMLKDSKTGKQGAAEFIITIGALDDFPNSRFLGTTKNKLAREGAPKSPKAEVTFDGDRGRYVSNME